MPLTWRRPGDRRRRLGRATWRAAGRDEARLRPDHAGDASPGSGGVTGFPSGAGAGRCSMPSVIDRHVDPDRHGPRTLSTSVRTTASTSATRTTRRRTPSPRAGVVFAHGRALSGAVRTCDLARLHDEQVGWHRQWTEGTTRCGSRSARAPLDPRDYIWPVAPAVALRRPPERSRQALSRSQTMSTPSFSARTTLAGCFLSM